MRTSRLEGIPDYNSRRRKGTGGLHLEICESCGYYIPENTDIAKGQTVPCSEYHVRCVRCEWPVAKTLISPKGLCIQCMSGIERRNYHRRRGTFVYGKVEEDIERDEETELREEKNVRRKQLENGYSIYNEIEG